MNIEDVERPNEAPKDILKAIFDKQTELMMKYKEIEGLPNWPLNLNLSDHQKILKDFKQRISEELAEAWEGRDDENHLREELIDALHFATELNILSGKDSSFFRPLSDIEYYIKNYYKSENPRIFTHVHGFWNIVYFYGLLCNTLKNKPWKVSQVRTDENKYFNLLKGSYESLISLLMVGYGILEKEIYDIYVRKNEVNKFRQRSRY